MSSNSVLSAAIGLALVFFLVALLCSAVVEWWANVVRKRAKYLLRGLRDILDTPVEDPAQTRRLGPTLKECKADGRGERAWYINCLTIGTGGNTTVTEKRRRDPEAKSLNDIPSWTREIMGHPLVRPFKQSRTSNGQTRNPSYLPSRTFAAALIDIIVPNPQGSIICDDIRAQVQPLPDTNAVKHSLLALLNTAHNDMPTLTGAIERWYDDTMDRISGSYKRWAKRWIIVVALAISVALQVDTIQIASSLYTQAPLREAIAAAATNGTLCPQGKPIAETRACLTQQLSNLPTLDRLPVGWGQDALPQSADLAAWPLKALGWAMTALAASFGAPFWFQALSKLGSLRNTGTSPARADSGSTP